MDNNGDDRFVGNSLVLWWARLITPTLMTALLSFILWALNNIQTENNEYRSKVEARLEQSDGKLVKLQQSQDELGTKVTNQLALFSQLIELSIKGRNDDLAQLRSQIADHETRLRTIERGGHR